MDTLNRRPHAPYAEPVAIVVKEGKRLYVAFRMICTAADLPLPGELREVAAGSRQLCIANDGGHYSAIDNICPHRGAPLAEGTLEGGKLICPWHAWAFDLQSGVADHDASERVRVYALRVQGNEVLTDIKDQPGH